VFILPSKAVSLRKLQFPFNNPRRILEALDFELENELLGRLDQHLYSHKIHPLPDESALVMVYLIEQTVLDALMQTCAQHQVAPARITFSAYSLYQATSVESPLHVQLYAGAEETFISVVQANRLQSVKAFPFNPIERILTATEGDVRTPRQFIQLLDRRHRPDDAEVPGPDAAPAPPGKPSLLDSMERRHSHSESERMLYLYRFRADLEGIVADLNQFLRLQALGEPLTLSVHGMFAPFLEWDAESGVLRLRSNKEEVHPSERGAMGVLEELQAHAQDLVSPSGIGFQRRRVGWWNALSDLRRPLAVMAAGLVLLAALALGNLYLGLGGLRAELRRAQGDLANALRAELRGAPADPAAGLRALRQQVEQARAAQSADSRFLDYDHEVLDMLEEVTSLFAERTGLTVESLGYNAERFSLSGKTPSYNDSESLRDALSRLPRFQGRDAKLTHQRTAQDITFRISIER